MMSTEQLKVSLEAYPFPDEFAGCDGSEAVLTGVYANQQPRKAFGLAWRTEVGNDVDANLGYKIHVVYGCLAAPSESAYSTINDSPDAITFSWDISTTPEPLTGSQPVASFVIDSTVVDSGKMALLEAELFGDSAGDANLPLPDDLVLLLT